MGGMMEEREVHANSGQSDVTAKSLEMLMAESDILED